MGKKDKITIKSKIKDEIAVESDVKVSEKVKATDVESAMQKPPVDLSSATAQPAPKTDAKTEAEPTQNVEYQPEKLPEQQIDQNKGKVAEKQSDDSKEAKKEEEGSEEPKENASKTGEGSEEPNESVSEEATPKEAPEPAKGVSPQIDKEGLKPVNLNPAGTPNPKTGGLKAIKKSPRATVSDATKKASEAVKKFVKEMVKKIAVRLAAAIGPWGWLIIGILIIILIIVFIIFGGTAVSYLNRQGGTTNQILAKPDSEEVKAIVSSSQTPAKGVGDTINGSNYHLFDFLSPKDKQYVQEGKVDKRLIEALNYLVSKHNRIAVSYIISTYNEMPVDPEASQESQLASNVSLHKRGMAADVSQIDFVYKSIEPSKLCAGGGLFGGVPQNDIVYTADNLPTTDPASIGSVDAASAFNNTSGTLQNISQDASGIASGGSQEISNKLEEVKNQINNISATFSSNASGVNDLKNNITALNNNLSNLRNLVSQSALSQEDKNSLNQKLDNLNQQLSTLSYRYLQLDALVNDISNLLNSSLYSIENEINSNISNALSQLDGLKSQLESLKNLPNTSIIRDLGSINSALSQISNTVNIANLGGSLDGLSGLLGGSNELLRLYCEGGPATGLSTKEAIPIKVSWQDAKPNIKHTAPDADESLTTDPRVYYSVYRPEARKKVHQVIAELLQFPYDMKNVETYKVSQLVTYSQERDVDPFASILNTLYGKIRPGNVGLFSMPESWAQVHIGF